MKDKKIIKKLQKWLDIAAENGIDVTITKQPIETDMYDEHTAFSAQHIYDDGAFTITEVYSKPEDEFANLVEDYNKLNTFHNQLLVSYGIKVDEIEDLQARLDAITKADEYVTAENQNTFKEMNAAINGLVKENTELKEILMHLTNDNVVLEEEVKRLFAVAYPLPNIEFSTEE